MNNKLKLSAAISLALLSGLAQADFTSSTGGTSSSVLFTATDTSNGNIFVLDLALGNAGLNFSSFTTGTNGANGTLSWNLGGYSQYSAFATDIATLNWSVVAGQSLNGTNGTAGTNTSTWGLLTTNTGPGTDTGTSPNFSNSVSKLEQAINLNLNQAFINANTTIGAPGAASNVGVSVSGSSPTPNFTVGIGPEQVAANTVYAIGNSNIDFYYISNSNLATKASASSSNTIVDEGTFSLSGNTLTYTSASATSPAAVPLPASAWLFVSAFMGVLGFNRKSKKA